MFVYLPVQASVQKQGAIWNIDVTIAMILIKPHFFKIPYFIMYVHLQTLNKKCMY